MDLGCGFWSEFWKIHVVDFGVNFGVDFVKTVYFSVKRSVDVEHALFYIHKRGGEFHKPFIL